MKKHSARLGTVSLDGKEISFGKEISSEVFKKLIDSIDCIEEHNQILQLYPLLLGNEQDLKSSVDQIKAEIRSKLKKSWKGVHDSELRRMTLEVNRKLLNYLSSKRSFVDHVETFIKRKFGEVSYEWKSYKALKHKIYDSSFAYRFFYKLRDYSQHCGKPIEAITFKIFQTNVPVIDIKISFRRDNLLEKFKEGWKGVKSDLEKQSETFEMIELLQELCEQIQLLYIGIKNIIKTNISSQIEYIKMNTDNIRVENSQVCVFSNFIKNKDGSLTYSIKYIPYDILDSLVE